MFANCSFEVSNPDPLKLTSRLIQTTLLNYGFKLLNYTFGVLNAEPYRGSTLNDIVMQLLNELLAANVIY